MPVIILAISVIIDLIVSKLICRIFCGTFDFWYDSNTTIGWFNKFGVIDTAIWLIRWFVSTYMIASATNFAVFLYDIAIIVIVIITIISAVKKKNCCYVIVSMALIISSMSLALITGFCPNYGQAQPLTLFVAIVFVFIVEISIRSVKPVRIITIFVLFALCLNCTKSISNYTVDNYKRFEYETSMLNDVGEELLNYPISNKRVAFVSTEDDILPEVFRKKDSIHPAVKIYQNFVFNIFDNILPEKFFKSMSDYYGFEMTDSNELANAINFNQRGYKSFISRTMWKDEFEPDVYKAMKRLGYNIKACTQEEYSLAEDMMIENDSSKKYVINEYDNIIVVQFMSID